LPTYVLCAVVGGSRALAFTSGDFGQVCQPPARAARVRQAETLRVVLSAVTVLVPGVHGRPELERAPVAGARLAAVPEAPETRKEDRSAVTKLLGKPGDLQNGPRDILAPEGHVMTGDRLGQDAAYFPAAFGSGSTRRPRKPRRASRGPAHRVPRPGEAGGPARNDADLPGLTVEGGHSAWSPG
jgi:hypothetical protein